ncbi:MAG: 4Fe-4S binding protein [Chloroflexi bacterium]|nr:4Fe-4S binding protein [Chloroflexota bacterium]
MVQEIAEVKTVERKLKDERLKVNFGGVILDNPIIVGSATPSWDGETAQRAIAAGAAAVVPKSIGAPQRFAQHPRCGRMRLVRLDKGRPFGMINLELYTTMDTVAWLSKELEVAAAGGAKIICSIVAQPDPADTAKLARLLESTGLIALIEINASCPMPDAQVGFRMGQDPQLVHNEVLAVKEEIETIPVGIKLTPNVGDLVPVAKAAKSAGADFLTISNSVRSFAGVDIETGLPKLPAYGGYTGPAIKPIIQRHVSEVARAVDIPISAVGGVMNWSDVVEYIMLGATTVQTVTAVMWNGYEKLGQLVAGLRDFMVRKGYQSIEEFRGIALPHIMTIDEYAKRLPKRVAIDRDLCTKCLLCVRSCFYSALAFTTEMVLTPENCDGCGLCVEVCPPKALRLE